MRECIKNFKYMPRDIIGAQPIEYIVAWVVIFSSTRSVVIF